MKIQEIALPLNEMPLNKFSQIGNFEKPGPFNSVDKKLISHPTNQLKLVKFFENTPFNFRIFACNMPGTGKYQETGIVDDKTVFTIFKQYAEEILDRNFDDITIVFVGNAGTDRVMMTPWIMAHRFGHAIRASAYVKSDAYDAWVELDTYFFKYVNKILSEYYNNKSFQYNDQLQANLFNAIGTQRSSRTNQIKRPYEFLYELFAQYLKNGTITLNPLPVVLNSSKKNWGRSAISLRIHTDYEDVEDREYPTNTLSTNLEDMFKNVLSNAAGNIFVM